MWLQIVQRVASCFLFSSSNPEPLFFPCKGSEFCISMIEVLLQGSSGTLHTKFVTLQINVHIFWKVGNLIAQNGLYFYNGCGKKAITILGNVSLYRKHGTYNIKYVTENPWWANIVFIHFCCYVKAQLATFLYLKSIIF